MTFYEDLLGLSFGAEFPTGPFGRVYCASLVAEVLRRRGIDVEIPTLDEGNEDELEERLAAAGFVPLVDGEAAEGDLLLFSIPAPAWDSEMHPHLGILVDPPLFLHVLTGSDVGLGSLDRIAWKTRLSGIYRRPSDG